jgi:tetratricopeptide (TPR) repeat protein
MANLTSIFNRALAAFKAGKLAEVESLCQKIILVKRNHFDALNLLAVAQFIAGKKDLALATYDRALAVRPNDAEALCNRGLILCLFGRFEEALASYDRALAARPNYAEALSNRGVALNELKRFDEALTSYDRALVLRSGYVEALTNRGKSLGRLQRFEEALASYDRVLTAQPNHAEALSGRGAALHELKRFDEALAAYDRILALRPDDADAHCSQAIYWLLTGDFDHGWEKFEWRWETAHMKNEKRTFAKPLWKGADEIAGKTILLHAEQGFGDTIQFSRYVPLVAARGANVILEVQKSLRDLMSAFPGITRVMVRGEPLPDFDMHCPFFSLPLAFGTRLETIPAATPYLHAPPQGLRDWEKRLGPERRLRIGLAWSGDPKNNNDYKRSIGLSSLLPLLNIDATFVCVQKDIRPADAAVLKDRGDILFFGDELKTFSDTAALISCLDLVISVDTTVAHLAGALARPVWVLLPFVPDWRWLLDRDDNPWYPTARLFRQDDARSWDKVIAAVRTALNDFVQKEKR